MLINKLKLDLDGSESNAISHTYHVARQFEVRVHSHSERVLGSSLGRFMGVGVNLTHEKTRYLGMMSKGQIS